MCCGASKANKRLYSRQLRNWDKECAINLWRCKALPQLSLDWVFEAWTEHIAQLLEHKKCVLAIHRSCHFLVLVLVSPHTISVLRVYKAYSTWMVWSENCAKIIASAKVLCSNNYTNSDLLQYKRRQSCKPWNLSNLIKWILEFEHNVTLILMKRVDWTWSEIMTKDDTSNVYLH